MKNITERCKNRRDNIELMQSVVENCRV